MKKLTKKNNKKWFYIFHPFIEMLIFFVGLVLLILASQPTKVMAAIPSYKPQDSCGLININFASTGPNCPMFSTSPNGVCQNPAGNPTSPNIPNQTLTVSLSSRDGQDHKVSYWTANSFCTNGYLNASGGYCYCNDNPIITNNIVNVPASGNSVPITVSRSPTQSSNCGSYQLDFSVLAVDGNTSCNSGDTSGNVGGSLTCETGITCPNVPPPTPTPPPNCTSTPINCSACAAPANTCSNGNGTQTCTLSQPQTCSAVVTTQSCTLNNCSSGNVCTNQTCQPPTYTVSGNVFTDGNKNGLINSGEINYTGGITVKSSKGTVTTNANGTYTISNILAGPVTISYTSLPNNYFLTSPLNGPPPSFTVTVGTAGCTVNGAPGASCNAGNITGLNFGISDNYPWWQSTCSDIRENPITDLLPAGASALISNATCNNIPGIIFTGNTDPNLGQGQDSSTNQVVGGASFPESYSPQSSVLSTSYSSLLSKAQTAGIPTTSLSSICTLSNCTLPANITHGVYVANGDVTLNAFTTPANQNYIFLINGNLTINGTITVPVGSTALFATSDNITVAPTVGTAANIPTATLSGWYVAGQSVILPTQGNCTDLRLNIAGSMVVDAEGAGGTLQNSRDLCTNDAVDPTITFLPRLDFAINAPQFIEQQQTISKEVTP